MAKRGISLGNCQNLIVDKLSNTGWTLCIGAGTSLPIFPSWEQLVTKLIAKDPGVTNTDLLATNLLGTFGADALIQAACDRLNIKPEEFATLLSSELYSTLKSEAGEELWEVLVRALESGDISRLNQQQWSDLLDFFVSHREFSRISALGLAKIVANVTGTGYAPKSILSFNAEPLFHILINAFVAKRHDWRSSKPKVLNCPSPPCDRITRSTSNRQAKRVPYYFCHGLLPVLDGQATYAEANSIEKLVFSEVQYLRLANSAFSWQSSTFLNAAINHCVVFVGVSLSDPNMRGWLSRIAENRQEELSHAYDYTGDTTSHFWINKRPASEIEMRWIESSVSHLGIRLIWVDNWEQTSEALEKMLGSNGEDGS